MSAFSSFNVTCNNAFSLRSSLNCSKILCMRVCVCVYVCEWERERERHTNIFCNTHIYICTHTYVYTHIHTRHTHTYTHTHTHTHTHTLHIPILMLSNDVQVLVASYDMYLMTLVVFLTEFDTLNNRIQTCSIPALNRASGRVCVCVCMCVCVCVVCVYVCVCVCLFDLIIPTKFCLLIKTL